MVKRLLDKLRHPGRTKSIVAYILFGAIIVVFVFFFQSGPLRGLGSGGTAAVVNDQVISLSDFRTRVNRHEEQLRSRLEGLPDSQRQMFSESIRHRAIEDLIMGEVLAQSAEKAGFLVSDAEVRNQVLEIPQFQVDGRFQRERYEGLLQANHLNSREFEEKIRKDLLGQKVQESFARAVYPSVEELDKEKLLRQRQLNIGFIEYSKETLEANLVPSTKEKEEFLASPKGKEEAEAYYNKNKASFATPEQVRAQHILIKMNAGDKSSEEQALGKIKSIEKRLEKEDFGQLAQELSEDEGSKEAKGDLNYFSRGKMVKEFEDTAFQLKVGEVSPPVKSPFGYHLIKVTDHRPGGERPFAEVASTIAEKLLASAKFGQASGRIEELVKAADQKMVESYLKSLKLTWQETGDFPLGQTSIPHLGENEKVVMAALSLSQSGTIYPQVLQVSGKYFLVKRKDAKEKKDAGEDALNRRDQARYFSFRRSSGLFEEWLNTQREKFTITMNQQLFREPKD